MHWAPKLFIDSGMEALLFNGIAGALALGAQVFLNPGLLPAFGFALLIESVGLMLIGGALDLSTASSTRATVKQLRRLLGGRIPDSIEDFATEERQKVGMTAATYALTGVMLFVEAGLLSLAYVR